MNTVNSGAGPLRTQTRTFNAPVRATVMGLQAAPTGVGFGMALVLADVFFSFSRILESHQIGIGPLSLAMACRGAALLLALLSGRLLVRPSSISRGMLLFTFWLFLATPFSTWRGGSVNLLLHFWLPALVAFLAMNALQQHVKDVRRCIYAIGLSSVYIVVTSLFTGRTIETRFDLGIGTLGNSNDLAQMLLLGLPALMLFLQLNKGRKYLSKILLLVTVLLMLRVIASTSSRAGVLTLLLYAVMLFASASGLGRFRMGVGMIIVGVVFFAAAPRATLMRYATILPFISADPVDEESATIKDSAEGSSAQRRALFQQSLVLTLRNPLFGVGPGTYDSAAADASSQEGKPAMWKGTHNTFTQISAECGIPGLLIYVATLVASFRAVLRVRKRTAGVAALGDLHRISFAMLMILACFTLNAAFASLAYLATFPMLAALSDALYRTAQREIAAREHVQPAASPSAPPAKKQLRLRPTPA